MVAFPYHVMVLFSQPSEGTIVVMARALAWVILISLGWSCGGTPPPAPPAVAARPLPAFTRAATPPSLSIQLVDGKTRAILAGVTATVTNDAHASWEGRADAEGGVHVPADIIADVMTVTVKGYRPATVTRHVGRRPKRVITVRLVRE